MNLQKLILILLVGSAGSGNTTHAQSNDQSEYEISELQKPHKAPNGYESVLTVQLDPSLEKGNAYEIGFWIFPTRLPDQAYSYPINVFPSNNNEPVNATIFETAVPNDNTPELKVEPAPVYSRKGYFTFTVRPDQAYDHMTIALQNTDSHKLNRALLKNIKVAGVGIRPLHDSRDLTKTTRTPINITKTHAEPKVEKFVERLLLDSEKTYRVNEKSIKIGLYDHRNIDKDVVTIYLNDSIVADNLQLKRKKRYFDVQLLAGRNTITLYAVDLGQVAPNTAAIIIKSSTQEFLAVLESDFKQSQFFTLIYEEP